MRELASLFFNNMLYSEIDNRKLSVAETTKCDILPLIVREPGISMTKLARTVGPKSSMQEFVIFNITSAIGILGDCGLVSRESGRIMPTRNARNLMDFLNDGDAVKRWLVSEADMAKRKDIDIRQFVRNAVMVQRQIELMTESQQVRDLLRHEEY